MQGNQNSTLSAGARALLQRRAAELDTAIEISAATFFEPSSEEKEEGGGLGGNRHFVDLYGVDYKDVLEAISFEDKFLEMIAHGCAYDDALEDLENETGNFFGLDPGISAAALSFSVLGAVPFSSCNGGILGGSHREEHPLVAFYAPSLSVMERIAELCTRANLGLKADTGRTEIIAYAGQLLPFRQAALFCLSLD